LEKESAIMVATIFSGRLPPNHTEFSHHELRRLAAIAPDCTLNIVEENAVPGPDARNGNTRLNVWILSIFFQRIC